MIYGYLWMLVLFCIFDIIFGLLNLVLYAVMRNPVFASIFGPTKASYSVSSDVSVYPDHQLSYYTTTPSIKGSEANLLNDTWESTTDGGRSRMTVRRALPSQAYINPPIAVISPAGTISSDSPDFDDLIFALKMGSAGIRSESPSDISGASGSESMSMHDDDISQLSIVLDHYETKRIDIADTHL
ncbi:G-protein coupled receptor 98 [Elysia marginata]|uniref:G-protein coupled receptor 98 n=1 Tax=Elysia marginata TaxID=1093978 RepID=A0AAV4GFZ5_9GAST|nr:G-protein coupled receptor 98 [Elysia marginata]